MKASLIFVLVASIGALAYFLLLNGQIVLIPMNIQYLGTVNFVSISHSLIAIFQLGAFVLFLRNRTTQYLIRIIFGVVILIIIVDLFALVLMKINTQLVFFKDLYFAIHGLIIFIDTGIFVVLYFVLRRFILRTENRFPVTHEIMKTQIENRNFKWYVEVSTVVLGIIMALYLMKLEEWKIAALAYIFCLLFVGFIKKWSQNKLSKIPVGSTWAVYIISIILGLVGGWYDFFTGFLFFYAAFGVLIFTSSRRSVSLARLFLSIGAIGFGTLLLVFHFMYSMN